MSKHPLVSQCLGARCGKVALGHFDGRALRTVAEAKTTFAAATLCCNCLFWSSFIKNWRWNNQSWLSAALAVGGFGVLCRGRIYRMTLRNLAMDYCLEHSPLVTPSIGIIKVLNSLIPGGGACLARPPPHFCQPQTEAPQTKLPFKTTQKKSFPPPPPHPKHSPLRHPNEKAPHLLGPFQCRNQLPGCRAATSALASSELAEVPEACDAQVGPIQGLPFLLENPLWELVFREIHFGGWF